LNSRLFYFDKPSREEQRGILATEGIPSISSFFDLMDLKERLLAENKDAEH